MELRHLRYFVAVAEELSFRKAAGRLRVAQPSLGRQIKDLEDEIGAPVFDRDRRHVALTDAGRVLLSDAKKLLAGADQMLATVREAAKGEAGVLRIGNVGPLSSSFLPDALAAFREEYPRVDIEIREMGPDEQEAAIEDGSIHIGIHRTDPRQRQARFSYRSLVTCGAHAILPSDHPLAEEACVRVEQLVNESFLTYRPAQGANHEPWLNDVCREYGNFKPKILRKTVEHWNTLFMMVAAKEGITLMPSVSVKLVEPSKRWVARKLRVPKDNFQVSAVWRAGTLAPILANWLPFLDLATTL